MNERRKTLAEITTEAFAVLNRELGIEDTIRFINQYRNGSGDYTAEREALFGHLTLEEILSDIKQSPPEAAG